MVRGDDVRLLEGKQSLDQLILLYMFFIDTISIMLSIFIYGHCAGKIMGINQSLFLESVSFLILRVFLSLFFNS